MARREKKFKYLEPQQEIQQISIFSNVDFTVKGATDEKVILSF